MAQNADVAFDPLNKDASLELFNSAKAVLSTHSPHFGQWQPNCSFEFCLPRGRFVKAIRIVTGNRDFAARSRMLALGILHNRWVDLTDVTPRELYNFCNWLKTTEGSNALQKERRIVQLAKLKYGASVREDHAMQFLGEDGRKEELIDYCNSMIVYYRQQDMPRQLDRFLGYLAALGGDEIV